jgi:hypothetical protein
MFAEIMIKEPLEKVADDWDYFDDKIMKHFSTFKADGTNVFGIRRRVISAAAVDDPKKGNINRFMELGPKGLTYGEHSPLRIRVTTAGTPHHVSHNFGYWHINDKDELYLPIPSAVPGELGHFVVIMGFPTGNETDAFAWYCEKCLTLLYDHVVETGRLGFNGFWKGETQAVRTYNSDIRLRTCVECGHVNPMGYCWNRAKDTPEETAARAYW